MPRSDFNANYIAEMREYAGFPDATRDYIARHLTMYRSDPTSWPTEAAQSFGIAMTLQDNLPDSPDLTLLEPFAGPLLTLTRFHLETTEALKCFSSYRFLLERLIGAGVRPWLPSAFCGASALPSLHPNRRRILLQSISEAAAMAPGWSTRQPQFYPQPVVMD